MSATSSPVSVDYEVNPFSAIAVAKVMESGWDDPVTVDTPAIKDALGVIRDYLVRQGASPKRAADAGNDAPPDPAAGGSGGNVLAVVGDYGTGKTHLVMRLRRYVRDQGGSRVRWVYLDASADSFLAVYQRFIKKLEQDEVRERVKQYYAEVVADSLGDSELTVKIADGLRKGTSDPVLVVERFALMESVLLRELQRKLRHITENAAFSTALMLLLRPGFETSVWSWLECKEPDALLVERGVTERIDNDASALEAMGVIALLYSAGDRRFFLVIDEIDRILSAGANPGADVLAAFKQLLRVFSTAGAMLVLAGLPDFLSVVSKDVRERIGPVVRMAPLTSRETRKLIEASQEQVFRVRRLAPFNTETVEYLVRLARGTARQIIRLCYHAFRLAADANTEVTIDIIEDAARDELYLPSTVAEVRDAVREVLNRNGWPFVKDHLVGRDSLSRVDYWITPPGAKGGHGIVVTRSVLNADDVAALGSRAAAIAQAENESGATLLVVNGYISAELGAELKDSFGANPLVYEPRSFTEALTAALVSVTGSLQVAAGDNLLVVLGERVERINRQQSNTHRHIEQVGAHLDALRRSSDRRLDTLADQMRALLQRRPTAVGGETAAGGGTGQEPGMANLPAEVDRIFGDALDALDELNRFDALLRDAFGQGDEQVPSGVRSMIRTRLSTSDATQAAGIAVLLRKTVGTFRDSVTEWYGSYLAEAGAATEGRAELSSSDRDRLDRLCSTYDAISEFLPPYYLAGLGELAALTGEDRDADARLARRKQQSRTRDILENLSLRVRQALLNSVLPTGW